MKEHLDWATKNEPEFSVALQAATARFSGQLRKARELSSRAAEVAEQMNLKEDAARLISREGLEEAKSSDCRHTQDDTKRSLALSRDRFTLIEAALNLGRCGDPAQTQSLIDEMVKRYPKFTLMNFLWLPVIRAEIEFSRGNYAQAVPLLRSASRYENASVFWIPYLLGQIYLRQQAGVEAAVEFQKIIAHRGLAPFSPFYPLAYLGLARASALTGETTKSRKAYQDFLSLWKDADPDIPSLQQAKQEYEKLK